jgi:general secretion pathway protein B
MSFILDALKKAERERRLGPRPAFEPVRAEPPRARLRAWPWPQVLGGGLVVLLAGAGTLTLWRSGPSEVERPVQAPAVTAEREVQAAAVAAPPATIPLPAPPAVTPRIEDLSAPKKAAAAPPAPRPRTPVTRPGPAVASAPPREARPVPVETARPSPGDTRPSEGTVPKAGPTGPGPGEPIPRMKLEVHVYSASPAARMVFINGRKYVEGEKIDGKYLLERITEDGATLAYQGQRLRLVP